MKKRTLMMALAIAAALLIATTGTLAYLTDTDSDVNVMTLGNVKIEQIELQRTENYIQNYDGYDFNKDYGDLEEFEQGQALYPAFPDPRYTGYELYAPVHWGDYVTAPGDPVDEIWLDGDLKGVLDKFVFVENTGKSPAYCRTLFAFECPEGITYGEEETDHMLLNLTDDNLAIEWGEHGMIEVDGQPYLVMSATYLDILQPGQIARPSLLQVAMKHICDNEDVEKFGSSYEILTLSQAVQAENFDAMGAAGALDLAFGLIDENAEEWFNGMDGVPVTSAGTGDELQDALTEGETVVLENSITIEASQSNAYGTTGLNQLNGGTIIGNGYTVEVNGANSTWDSAINTTGGTIQDLTVSGAMRGIFINHNSEHSEPVILKNVVFEDVVYTISCDQGVNQTLTAYNCTFNGWTSYAATLGEVTFNDCYFGEGSGYAFCRPYAPTEFVNCTFEEGFEMDPVAAVTLTNCYIGDTLITADNLSTLVTSNIANATVK